MTDAADVIESWYITFRARFHKHAVGIWAVSHHGRVLSFIAAALIAFSTAGPAHAQVEPGHCDNAGLNATKVVAQLAIHGASTNRPSATSTVTLTLPRTWQGTAQLLLSPDDSQFKNAVNCLLGGQEGEQGHYSPSVAVTQTGVAVIDVETIDDFSWIGPQVLGSVDLGPWRLTGQDRARTFTIGPTQSSGYDSTVPKAEWTSVTVTCDDGSAIEVSPCRPMPQAAQS